MIGALIAKRNKAAAFEAANQHDLAKFISDWRGDRLFTSLRNISEPGTHRGKAVEAWFRRFLEQFPVLRFEAQAMCVRDMFDLVGSDGIAARWTRRLTNRVGPSVQDRGVTMITGRLGKVVSVEDFFFGLGDDFQSRWSAA